MPLTFRSNVPADKLLALTWQAQIKRDLNDCLVLNLDGVESTTVYRQLGEGVFKAVMLDWRGTYPDPEAYLTPLLVVTILQGPSADPVKPPSAAVSGRPPNSRRRCSPVTGSWGRHGTKPFTPSRR